MCGHVSSARKLWQRSRLFELIIVISKPCQENRKTLGISNSNLQLPRYHRHFQSLTSSSYLMVITLVLENLVANPFGCDADA